jgi:hypothetical protein
VAAGLPSAAALAGMAALPSLGEALARLRYEIGASDQSTFLLWMAGLVVVLAVVMLGIRPTR